MCKPGDDWQARLEGHFRSLARAADPRGEHKESTLYAGTHWIDCYVVKDGRVRATDRHAVEIL